MTILRAQSIEEFAKRSSLIEPFVDRYSVYLEDLGIGLSGGLGPHGYDIALAEDVVIMPGRTVLASSRERFNIPDTIRGAMFNKSTWRRLGVECGAATILEAGWRGHLTIEISYFPTLHSGVVDEIPMLGIRPGPICIPGGTPIGQVEFSWLDGPTSRPYDGRYQDQPDRPVPAKGKVEES